MKPYQTVKPSENSNLIVNELNAVVLTLTFKGLKGEIDADLYTSKNSSDCLVLKGSCSPINMKYVKTVKIIL
jgi:hypothetical protein